MKKGMKLFAAGAAVAAVAGLIAFKKYQDSYEQLADEEIEMADIEEDDFIPVEEIDDGFDYILEDEEQILFYE